LRTMVIFSQAVCTNTYLQDSVYTQRTNHDRNRKEGAYVEL